MKIIFEAAANTILLRNNEAGLTPKEVFFFGEAMNNFGRRGNSRYKKMHEQT